MRTFANSFTLPSGGNWWNNSSTLTTKSPWNTKLASSGVIVDAKNTEHINDLLTSKENKLNYTVRNEMFSTLIPGNSVNNADGELQEMNRNLGQSVYHFENALRFNDDVISTFNQYKFVFANQLEDIFSKSAVIDNPNGSDAEKDIENENVNKFAVAEVISSQHVPSLFNPYMAVDVIGISHNIPIYNNIESFKPLTSQVSNIDVTDLSGSGKQTKNVKPKAQYYQTDIAANMNKNFTDCSIKTLVSLSNTFNTKTGAAKELGQERFKYADFMFCKDVGRISNNYLITLRRFASPIGDDITCSFENTAVAPDIGRMLCYIGEDNKLEDILKYQYQTTWKELTSKIQEKSSEEDSPDRGIIGSVVNLANPVYMQAVAKGTTGSGNQVLDWVKNRAVLGKVLDNKGTYEGSEILGNYDQNRVYEPQDTVQDTHTYEGKLKFQQEFTLTFNYEMRAYDNINPRTAFLDLLSNIHVVTYRHGSFWGGERKFKGVSANVQGWKKANAFIDQAWDKLGGFCEGLLTGNVDWQSVWGSISSSFGKIAQEAKDFVNNAASANPDKSKAGATGAEIGKKVTKTWKDGGYSDAFKGMLKNRLGRPAMYAWDALLKGDPVGFHHVTIGNPRAPIMSIGNLIITNTTIQHYGPLGIDDFPTGLKVMVTLKHAKSRDAIDIQQMYTGGKGSLSVGFSGIKKVENYYNFGIDIDDKNDPNRVHYATNGGDISGMNNKTNGKDKSKTGGKYGYVNPGNPAVFTNIFTRFGTNNVDQIVANAAIHARKI